MNISISLISISLGLLSILALLRFMLQLNKVDFYNPSVQFVCRFTDIYCGLIRKIIPTAGRFDIASIFMALAIQFASIYIIFTIFSTSVPSIVQIALWSLLVLAGLALRIYFIALILMVIFSWVRPQGSQSLMDLSNQLIRPLLAPFHKFIPSMGGLDFSPMALFFLIYLLQSAWRSYAISMEVPLRIIFAV